MTSEADHQIGLRGVDCIRHYTKTLDGSPGVYRMLGSKGEVLYVGKAKHLKNRVRNYLNPMAMGGRIERMVSLTASMMFLTTKTETEALLLEQNLIKQLKPHFNVLLRDDKSFPTIYISTDHPFPQIRKHRGKRELNGKHYGPFASAAAVNRTINQLQKVFLIRNCSDAVFNNRTRPCLQYQIKRCSAPCVGLIEEDSYAELVNDAQSFLRGKTSKIQQNLASKMDLASKALEFEKAAALRDRIQALTQIQSVQGINPQTVSEADVIGLSLENGKACVQVFFIRSHQNWGNKSFFPKTGEGAEEAEILKAFLGQFYSNKHPPQEILLSHPIEDYDPMVSVLSELRGTKVKLNIPKRGERALLIENAVRNARESLNRKLSEVASQILLFERLAEKVGLDEIPEIIEVYDNSHIQGSYQYGTMICVGKEGFLKSSYRKYKIKDEQLTPGDDNGMMREVFTRRFRRLLEEDPEKNSMLWPDLIIVDGGKGQLTAAKEILENFGLDEISVISVSKGPNRDQDIETIHLADMSRFKLEKNDSLLFFIQRIRDEAHRFAIGTHRSARRKNLRRSSLDAIPGIGAGRKHALLHHFGSVKEVKKAGIDDLKAVQGISESMARTIHSYYHDTQ